MPIMYCPGCRGEVLMHTPSDRPGFWNRVNRELMQIRVVTCLDCGLISNYATEKAIAVLRGRKGLKPSTSGNRDEI